MTLIVTIVPHSIHNLLTFHTTIRKQAPMSGSARFGGNFPIGHRTAIFHGPMEASAEFNLGRAALTSRRIPEAIFYFNSAQRRGYSPAECAAHRWDCWMLLGQFELAWRESDFIASFGLADSHRLWDGSRFEGKRIIIRCLHGLGDTIQFIRFAKLFKHLNARVIAEVPGELKALLAGVPFVDRVVSWTDGSSQGFADWDVQIEVMELPRVFRTTPETIPAVCPYIFVCPQALRRSADSLRVGGPSPRVGVVWGSGNWNPDRSIPIAELAAALTPHCISLYSFQHGPHHDGLDVLRQIGRVHDTAEHSIDISDTAADLMNIDLLITVDTMIAHLAGALGRMVWTLLPFEADWRWMLNRQSTPWYPTMSLFRQKHPGDWSGVLADISAKLSSSVSIVT